MQMNDNDLQKITARPCRMAKNFIDFYCETKINKNSILTTPENSHNLNFHSSNGTKLYIYP